MPHESNGNNAVRGRLRERESAFPMIPVDEAIGHVLANTVPLKATVLNLADIPAGSILAMDVTAPEPLPPFPASVMDGYALVASDGEGVLEVVGRITAGVDPDSITVSPGKCAYITTGAKLPQGADAVVRVEDTAAVDGEPSTFSADEKSVRILKGVRAGQNVRPVGRDITEGTVVLRAGEKLQAAEIGLLATVGVWQAEVIPPPRVGVMSTGDELVEPNEPIKGGFIRDSNRSTLLAAIAGMGGIPVDLGIVRDKESTLKGSFEEALKTCDVLVTSGGVSMGEADLLKPILESMGTIHFGRICMKPGKPTTFATVDVRPPGEDSPPSRRLVFALPGNPVSSLVCSHLFVMPALRKMRGYGPEDCLHTQVEARLTSPLGLDPIRPEYHRALVSWNGIAGRFDAVSTGAQMSSRLLSMKSANALLCLPTGDGVLPAGREVPAILIGSLPSPTAAVSHHGKAIESAEGRASRTSQAGASGGSSDGASGPTGYVSFPPSPTLAARKGDAEGAAPAQAKNDGKHGQPNSQSDSHAHGHNHGAQGAAGKPRTHIRACLLTVSDRASQGIYEDLSGPAMRELLQKKDNTFDVAIVETKVVPDEPQEIQAAIRKWCDDSTLDLVLTSGGTGFGRRDLTPESIRPLLHREAPGIVHAIFQGGLKHTPLAVLSRPVAGTRNNTLVVTLPGSVKAVKENLASVIPLLPRIVNLLQGNDC